MKRNLLAIFALVLAVGFSSFTAKKNLVKYFIYDDTNPQNQRSSYSEVTSAATQNGNSDLAWIKIDEFDGIISDADFGSAFEVLDQVADNDNSLDDDSEGSITTPSVRISTLEKKN